MIRFDSKMKKRFKIAGIVIGVLLVIGLISFAALVGSCLSFDETGAHVKDRFGILAMESGKQPEQMTETPQQTEDGQTEQQPAEGEAPSDGDQDTKTPAVRALFASAERMANDEEYMAEIESAGRSGAADQVVTEFKDVDGRVSFRLESSVVSGVWSSFAKWFKFALEEADTAGLETYAMLHCFHDSKAVESDPSIAVHTADGGLWTDADGSYWLDPTDEDVQDYLIELVEQSVEAGAKEIILRDFVFPSADAALTYDEQDGSRAEQLMQLYSKLQRAAGEVPVSIWLDDPTADSETTGQDIKKMYRNAYRLYAPASDAAEAQQLAEQIAAKAGGSAHLVPVYDHEESYDILPGGAVCGLE